MPSMRRRDTGASTTRRSRDRIQSGKVAATKAEPSGSSPEASSAGNPYHKRNGSARRRSGRTRADSSAVALETESFTSSTIIASTTA